MKGRWTPVRSLPPTARTLLSRLAAFRSGLSWEEAETIFCHDLPAEAPQQSWLKRLLGAKQHSRKANLKQEELLAELKRLEERGLLQRTVRRWENGEADTHYDLHPIVRRYAYDRLSDRAGMHGQLAVRMTEKQETRRGVYHLWRAPPEGRIVAEGPQRRRRWAPLGRTPAR